MEHGQATILSGLGCDAVVFDEAVGHHVEGGADAEVVVKADGVGAVGGGLGEIGAEGLLTAFDAEFVDGFARVQRPVHAEVPFADAGGVVALALEHGGDGEAPLLDEARAETAEDGFLQLAAPVVAAGDDTVTRGRADGGGGVCVGEDDALTREAVYVRGGDLAFGVQAAHVTIAEVVAEDEDEVRLFGGLGGDCECEGEEGKEVGFHKVAVTLRVTRLEVQGVLGDFSKTRPSFSEARAKRRWAVLPVVLPPLLMAMRKRSAPV